MVYAYIEYYSALKRKSDTRYNINLENIILSEIRQSQKYIYCLSPCISVPRTVKFIDTENIMVVMTG